jgi:imidazoleglycerol-phosphate dehydratase
VSIAIGQVLNKALGSKAGLNRMWTSSVKEGDAEVEVVMDLSNRPCFTHNLDFGLDEMCGGISMEMVEHVFDSFVMNGHMTVHVVQKKVDDAGLTTRDVVLATARAFGAALNKCIAVDPRRAGKTASSKGTLSV